MGIKEENLKQDDYTEETWAKFNEYLIALELAVKDNKDIDQNKLSEIITSLNTQKENLKKKSINIDKSTLEDLYNLNKDKVNDRYTVDSWNILQSTLEKSNTIINDKNATKEDVENALAGLTKAIQSLSESQKEEPQKEDPQKEEPKKEQGTKEEYIKAEDGSIDDSNKKEDNEVNSDKNYLAKTGDDNSIISIEFSIVIIFVGAVFIIYYKKNKEKINI